MRPSPQSDALLLLHEKVRRWIWKQGWRRLREVQERAVRPILAADRDVVIAAATAEGKTEAAFLPIVSNAAAHATGSGLYVLYVSPLKALINDQHHRLEDLFACVELPAARWHGDIPQREKLRVRESPRGALLITPESLESVFINYGSTALAMFSGLAYVVVDELHAFIGAERGRHLQSLLHRVDLACGRKVPRVALSATLGDMEAAAAYLRPDSGLPREIIRASGSSRELWLKVRGYRAPAAADAEDAAPSTVERIANHLFNVLRGRANLVFTNSRAETEQYADRLRARGEAGGVPNEFWPHHGSLARALREDVEAMLREGRRPATAICTSTLELGIDIGSVASVAQIGSPPAVASLRQRLGRSGRRGEPSVLRIYVAEPELTADCHPDDLLRVDLIQAIAMVRLLLEHWYEPPPDDQLHLSTLVHQILSLIAERAGVRAADAYRTLCEDGPFAGVAARMFGELLRAIGEHDLISRTPDGLLILGLRGERIVNRRDFYAVFQTPEEYRLVGDGRPLGSLPILFPVVRGSFIIFAGRRWEAVAVDEAKKVIDLRPAAGGKPPAFGGRGAYVHDRVRQEMFEAYQPPDKPSFLDVEAGRLLEEGRENFRRLSLATRGIVTFETNTTLFPWRGDRVMNTIVRLFQAEGVKAYRSRVSVTLDLREAEFLKLGRALTEDRAVDPVSLARAVENKVVNKFDAYLTESLLAWDYATREFDVPGALAALKRLARA